MAVFTFLYYITQKKKYFNIKKKLMKYVIRQNNEIFFVYF